VQLCELGDQGQADAGAGGVVGDVAALVEGLKDLLAELGRDPRSLVFDFGPTSPDRESGDRSLSWPRWGPEHQIAHLVLREGTGPDPVNARRDERLWQLALALSYIGSSWGWAGSRL
jgi:hypothetical protein